MQNKSRFYRVLLFFIFAGFSTAFSRAAGTERIDSLLATLALHQAEDTVKVNLCFKISFEYYLSDSKKGIEYGTKGAALAERLHYMHGLIFCLISTGACYWAVADYPHALELLLKALKLAEQAGDKQGIARASGNLGNVYAEQPDYPKALEFYNKALAISTGLGDTRGVARNLGNIGTIYKEMQTYPKALEYYFNALKNYEVAGEKRGIAVTLANIAWVYSDQSKYFNALSAYWRSLKIAEKAGERRVIMYDFGNIGEVYYKMATDTSEKYRRTLNSLSDNKKKSFIYLSLNYSEKAVQIAKDINSPKQLITWYLNLSLAYKKLGNWEKAYFFSELSYAAKDTVFRKENSMKMAKLETERENEIKSKESQLQNARLEKANVQRIAMAGGLLGLLIIVLLIYRSRRNSERLLRNMLPAKIASRLKKRENPIADRYDHAAIVFVDIVEFTQFSRDKSPEYLVEVLTDFFARMDELADKHGMEKIKTIGDGYLAVCGLPEPNPECVSCAARFALESLEVMRNYRTRDGQKIRVRIGIDAGVVVAGIIGEKRFSYDLWGDTVNTASRMESLGLEGEVQITDYVRQNLGGNFVTRERGEIEVKGKGIMKTWLLVAPVETPS